MSSHIQVLDQNTINQIAAGEVIERPASIVKELLENAIDAKASAITVEIKEGGISFIRITDNGTGIFKDDIPVAFLRHSTSKIKDALDLLTVSSLGFRGEALSSIAAIAMVELITKTSDAVSGVRYVIEGGEEKSFEEIGVPNGTTFIIRNIFFNTPARRKFLKTPTTEASYISDIVERIAISHPEISVRFIVNGQNKLHTSGNGSMKDVIYNVYGREITSNLLEVNASSENMKLTGYIGKPVINRGNRNFENYFINGRYIKSGFVSRAIEEAFSSFMMQHKYPFTCLNLEISQELIDVNVHPTKMELRFRNQNEIYPFIFETINNALRVREMIPKATLSDIKVAYTDKEVPKVNVASEVKDVPKVIETPVVIKEVPKASENFEKKETAKKIEVPAIKEIPKLSETSNVIEPHVVKEETKVYETHDVKPQRMPEPFEIKRSEAFVEKIEKQDKKAVESAQKEEAEIDSKENIKPVQIELFDDKLLSKEARIKHKIIGQVFETYWIVEYGDKMFLIDQHAAHEKVLYERLVKRYDSKENLSQELNPPIILSLTMKEEEVLNNNMQVFNDFGYEVEHMGGSEYAIRAVPYDLLSLSDKDLFIEILDGITSNEFSRLSADTLKDRMATMSCKAAVKGNNKLSFREANELIDELLTLENPYNCPHGRPTIISMSKYELEKKFKRIV